ncbi:MAG: hypothetical protein LBD71_00715 [Treponema sp.]|nr:hypothetical protein [Treponema sp.]
MNVHSGAQYGLLSLVPEVRRARDFRLYTPKGRLIDLWQGGGAAVLGHTPPLVLRNFKNAAERRLFTPLPHFFEGRFLKALSLLFPGRIFRVYGPGTPLRMILEAAGFGGSVVHDPAFGSTGAAGDAGTAAAPAGAVSLWRPFISPGAPLSVNKHVPVLIPVLPVMPAQYSVAQYSAEKREAAWPCGLGVLALDPEFEKDRVFPPSDVVAPVIFAAAVRGIYDLTAMADGRNAPFHRLQKGAWRRRGIYLVPDTQPGAARYAALFRRFLEGGFLLPPDPGFPLILPGVLSPGEEAALAKLLEFC